ncbi:hypothetical protein TWF281_006566 [Arthrobotrys megalospora]
MGLLDHISSTRRKERKVAKEIQKIKDQAASCSTSESSEAPVLSEQIKSDIITLRRRSPQHTPTPDISSSTAHNAGSSINIPKHSAGKGPVPVQEEHRDPPKSVTRSENIPSDRDSSSSDSSSASGKKRSAESKAARERQREMINFQKNTPNDLLSNQTSLVTSMPWVYPDTAHHDSNKRNSVHSSDSDKTPKPGATCGGGMNNSNAAKMIEEAETLNPGYDGVHKGSESPTIPKEPESPSYHSPASYHTAHTEFYLRQRE